MAVTPMNGGNGNIHTKTLIITHPNTHIHTRARAHTHTHTHTTTHTDIHYMTFVSYEKQNINCTDQGKPQARFQRSLIFLLSIKTARSNGMHRSIGLWDKGGIRVGKPTKPFAELRKKKHAKWILGIFKSTDL